MFKVNNKDTRKTCSSVSIVNLEHVNANLVMHKVEKWPNIF